MTRSSATPPSSPRRRAPPPIVPLQLIQSRPPESLAAGHKYLTVALCFSTGAAYVHLGSSCRTQRSLVAHIRWSAHRLNSIRLQPCSGQSGTKMKSSVFFSLNSTYQIQLRLCPMTWLADVLSMLLLVRKMLLFRFPSCGQYGAVGISTHEAIQCKQCISWSFHKSVRAF
ncbi:uncharacterized protein LOC119270443 isoform X3 [Triticum dicoccoides]|uniref:uncharacterized protein LOC119270443 isoform X3 n=1 Tax=Triticum dicoccoides TaxID=85692 RepID=UPI00188EA146|nr:uncharacterized protein LOC119270443 isoform X3 [Triticum dicoccoides]